MLDSKILDDLSARVAAAFAAIPVRDAEKNLKAMLTGALAKLDLVTREEFDVQARVLLRTREKLEALEARVAELEARAARPLILPRSCGSRSRKVRHGGRRRAQPGPHRCRRAEGHRRGAPGRWASGRAPGRTPRDRGARSAR